MIKTKRLLIQPYCDDDENAMIELLTNHEIKETYIIPDFNSIEDAKDYFRKLLSYSKSSSHYERGIYFNNRLIGFVNDVYIDDKTIEIGYVIHPNYHNRGFATEALKAVIDDLLFLGFQSILTCAFESNLPSFRVMEKCGMKMIDKTITIFHQNKNQRCLYYSFNLNH